MSTIASRFERLRKARNVNEVAKVLKEIAVSVTALKVKANKLIESISTTRKSQLKALSSRETEFEIVRDGSSIKFANTNRIVGPNGAIKLAQFVKPPTKELVKNNDVLSDLFDNLQQLKEAIALLEQGFSGAKHQPAALKAAKMLYKEVDDKIGDAFASIDSLAQKHMPTELSKIGNSAVTYIIKTLGSDRYSDLSTYCHIAVGNGGEFLFSFYIVLKDLKSDSGFVFDKYYVVFTGRVVEGNLSIYVNSLPDFKLPGKYQLGPVLTSSSIKIISRYIDEFMSQNDVSLEINRLALPLTKERAIKSGMKTVEGVSYLTVSDDTLTVVLKGNPTGDDLNNIVVPIISRLQALVGNRRRTSKIQYRKVKVGNRNALEFILVNILGASKKINKSALHDIQAMLELTDKQVEHIKEAQRSIE